MEARRSSKDSKYRNYLLLAVAYASNIGTAYQVQKPLVAVANGFYRKAASTMHMNRKVKSTETRKESVNDRARILNVYTGC